MTTTENYVPKLKRLLISTAADAVLITGVAGKTVSVHGLLLQSVGGTVSLDDESGGVFGPFILTAAPMNLPLSQLPYFQATDGDALTIQLSATDLNTGVLFYTQE